MAAFIQTGRHYAGSKTPAAVNGGASPVALTDTLTLNGRTLTIQEWVRRGVLRTASVAGNLVTFTVENNPESV